MERAPRALLLIALQLNLGVIRQRMGVRPAGQDPAYGVRYFVQRARRGVMSRSRPSQDIRPLSEFRASVASFVEQVQSTKRPLVLTQHGRSAAILLAVDAYEALLERVELAEDVRTADAQIAADKGVAHGKAQALVLARLRSTAAARKRGA